MTPDLLDKYRQQLYGRVPLIGGWFHSQALKSLADDGSAEAVRVLEEASVWSGEDSVRPASLEHLRRLAEEGNVAARESMCRLVIQHNEQFAWSVVKQAGYEPHDDSRRALFFFLTGQWAEYEALDFEHRLLREAYDAAEPELRGRIAAKARKAGRLEWVEVVTGAKRGKRLGAMTDEEWQAAVTVLIQTKRPQELWRLAQEATPSWSAKILHWLAKSKWRPGDEDRPGFETLCTLATKWNEKHFEQLIYHRASLQGHSSEIRSLVVTPNGKLLASGGSDHAICLWSLPDGQLLQKMAVHKGWINSLVLGPDGRTLASSGRDGRVCLWNLPNGQELYRLKGHDEPVYCLAFTRDNRILAGGSSDKTIQLWSVTDGKHLRTLRGHKGGVSCLAISTDGSLLASGSGDCTVRVWGLPRGGKLHKFSFEHGYQDQAILSLALSPDGTLLAAGCSDKSIHLWTLPGGKELDAIIDHDGPVNSLAITPDGKLLVSGGGDHAIRVYSLPDADLERTLKGGLSDNSTMVMSKDGRLIASSSGGDVGTDYIISVWSLRDERALRTLAGHNRSVTRIAFSADGRLLASGDTDGTINIWSAELDRLARLPAAESTLNDLQWLQTTLRSDVLSISERQSVSFLEALLRWRRRADIVVDEAAPRVIAAGEFDIEIEG